MGQKYHLWHWCVNMAFWQCFIPALIMEFQDPMTQKINPIEMSFAIAIGVTLSTLFGIRTFMTNLPTADFIAMIKSSQDAPQIMIRNLKTGGQGTTAEADVVIGDDEPIVMVHAHDDQEGPLIEEIREGSLNPIGPILKIPS